MTSRSLAALATLSLMALAAGCAPFPLLRAEPLKSSASSAPGPARTLDKAGERPRTSIRNLAEPAQAESAPPLRPSVTQAKLEDIETLLPERKVDVALPPQSIPQFIDTVFGQVLQTPYYMGPGVAERRDVIALRGTASVSNRTFFAMVQTALMDYGLSVGIENGVVRIVEDPMLFSQSPLFVRTRALPDVPVGSQPVVQFLELRSLQADSVASMVRDSYPNRDAVRITARADLNALVIAGNARDVAAIGAIVERLDKPRFVGGHIARVKPVYWTGDRLTSAVTKVLRTEGYNVANADEEETAAKALVFLPVPFTNDLLVFSSDQETFARALYWIEELDKASAQGDQETAFIYTAQNMNAADLGALVGQVSSETRSEGSSNAAPAQNGRQSIARTSAAKPSGARNDAPVTSGRITVDPGGNRVLFRGTPAEYEPIRTLLEQLDTPPTQVLVEVTIAEVTLTDDTRFGVEWFFQKTVGGGNYAIDTRGGLGREAGGLGVKVNRVFSRSSVQAALNAIAESRNLNILSTPRIVARSGGEAQILVGTDVPVITSQRAASNQTGGDTDILQTVQYRQTGVILNIRPVVYGDGRVDIELYQEVSSQEPNRNTAIASPIILNRSVTTQLSLREGMTAVIGGMMQDNYSRSQTGLPVLKDVPLVGQAFRTDSVSGSKVELLLLITPYVLRNDQQMLDAASVYSSSLNQALRSRGPNLYTLLPWRAPFGKARVHGGVPTQAETPPPSAN